MKLLISASLLALLTYNVTAQADTALASCRVGTVCNNDVGGTGVRDILINDLQIPGTYKCTFTVTGTNRFSPKKVQIARSRHYAPPYPHLLGKSFKLNEAPLVVTGLPAGPSTGTVISFANDWRITKATSLQNNKNSETRFSVYCEKTA